MNANDFRRNPGQKLNRVQDQKDSIVIKKAGQPVAVLTDVNLFEQIRRMRDQLDTLSNQIAAAYAGVPAEQGMAEIEAATTQARYLIAERGEA